MNEIALDRKRKLEIAEDKVMEIGSRTMAHNCKKFLLSSL